MHGIPLQLMQEDESVKEQDNKKEDKPKGTRKDNAQQRNDALNCQTQNSNPHINVVQFMANDLLTVNKFDSLQEQEHNTDRNQQNEIAQIKYNYRQLDSIPHNESMATHPKLEFKLYKKSPKQKEGEQVENPKGRPKTAAKSRHHDRDGIELNTHHRLTGEDHKLEIELYKQRKLKVLLYEDMMAIIFESKDIYFL